MPTRRQEDSLADGRPAGRMSRREAVQRVTTLLGGIALVGGDRLLAASVDAHAQTAVAAAGVGAFTADEVAWLDEVAETILPETTTPGAKAARTGAFMALMVTDVYSARDQRIFRDGMRSLDARCRQASGVPFAQANAAQRLALLEQLDREQRAMADRQLAARRTDPRTPDLPADDEPAHYFRMMKELALLGYFTSEIGYTRAMRYVESPGRFDPCTPYTPGETVWAPHA
jgi:hypothetical protein